MEEEKSQEILQEAPVKRKYVRRKFDHPLTEEEKKENQKIYWKKWYQTRGKYNKEFMEKNREKVKKYQEGLREYKKKYEEEHKDD